MTNPITAADSIQAALENKNFDTGTITDAGALTGVEMFPVSRGAGKVQTTLAKLTAFTSASTIATLQVATIANMLALPATGLVNNQQISVANYATTTVATVNDHGGGTFIWNAASTATPDLGVTFAPTGSLTAITGASLGTGNGSTLTFSGTLANGILNPGSVSITGAASAIVDDGAGNLMLGGLPTGTINYTTGAWTLTLVTAPAGAITGSYLYVSVAGRWMRQFSGNVNALWWGLGVKTIAGTDTTSIIQAANNYAYANSLGLEISVPPGYPIIRTSYTITLTSRYVNAMPVYGSDSSAHGIYIYFSAASSVDLYPAFIVNGESGQRIRGIYVVGSTTNNLFTVSLATMSTNGAINTTTIGDLSVYTTVPPYSAFAAGPAAFSLGGGSAQPIFDSCGSRALKIGLVLNGTNGHTNCVDCAWGGGISAVYVQVNSESFIFRNGSLSGGFSSVLFGDTLVAGHYGGISGLAIFENIDFGFAPYAFFQVHDNASTVTLAGGVSGTLFLNCGFEAIGEAAFKQLPYSIWAPQFVNCGAPGSAGTYSSTYNLPAAFTMSNGYAAFWIWCGTFQQFKHDGFGSGSWGFATGGNVGPTGVAITQGFVSGGNSYQSATSMPLRPQDLSFFGSGLVIVNSSGVVVSNGQLDLIHPSFLNPQSRMPEATKNILTVRRDFASQRNLLPNPEIAANWNIQTAGNAVTIGSYSSLSASLPAVTSMPVDMVQELGANPNVVQIAAGTATSVNPYLNYIGSPAVIPHPTNVGISFWVYVGTATLVGVQIAVYTNSAFTAKLYSNTVNLSSANGWYKVLFYGQNAYQNSTSAADNYYRVTLSGGATLGAGNCIYVAGVMSFTDEITAYTPYNGPSATAPITPANYAAASLPAASNLGLGAQAFCTNGRNTGEAASAGTGCPVFVKTISGTNTWCATWSGVAVTT